MPNLPEITIDPSLRPRLQQGHPWIYRNHIAATERIRSGQWVRVRCGSWSAYGLWDATSPIAVRIFSRHVLPDADWFAERVWEAWELRAALRDTTLPTNAYRWIYGEGDALPGLVADRYGDYAVIHTYAESVAAIVPQVAAAMRSCDHDLRGVAWHPRSQGEEEGAEPRSASLRSVWGELPPRDLVVQEHGLFFHADLWHGQKTGLFLDQRENRRMVESLAAGRRVLNCFAYTGGFSLYALRGGAAEVISADIGRGLAEAAAQNVALNQLPAQRHQFVTEDCFALLDGYVKSERRFDLLILDPPSFARAKGSAHAAQRAYTRLNALAIRCIEPGGLLVTASCTSQIGPEAFRAMLAEVAATTQRRIQIIHEAGQPCDHPVPAAFPEGRYLKFLVARILPLG
ncbi:SAM-dependent methyltransferase [Oscillochloris trichoides DG-6]|uniref:SAM-dependent methyltransferase n=1 Tax=Oscillochloris trichoides DG-6 TaxID=765420 RepID=E1IDP7_9CHLR|nr:class I SAM-dependent rRNA methyltransferase [Oscillochloris trichoides]EFO80675.1 SAM-dependent methyltransferase [Oscillochloris trichoides DG-6]